MMTYRPVTQLVQLFVVLVADDVASSATWSNGPRVDAVACDACCIACTGRVPLLESSTALNMPNPSPSSFFEFLCCAASLHVFSSSPAELEFCLLESSSFGLP